MYCPCFTCARIYPRTMSGSPVYVRSWILVGRSRFEGQQRLNVASDTNESDASVSTSIGSVYPSTSTSTISRERPAVWSWFRVYSSVALSVSSTNRISVRSARCLFSLGAVEAPRLRHTALRCPVFPHLWHFAVLNLQVTAVWFFFPHLKQVRSLLASCDDIHSGRLRPTSVQRWCS